MPKNHACEETESKYTKELTLFKDCTFLKYSREISQLKMENHAWQPIFDRPL